jgi:uncharacterized protein YajQ (UPF0234 family)
MEISMPSFDVVNKVNMQEVSNVVNNASKEILQRYDFRGSNTQLEWESQDSRIVVRTEDEMKMEAVREILINHGTRRKLDAECMDFKDVEAAGGKTLRREVLIRQGIDQDTARKIVKDVKGTKIRVQVSIQGDELRVSGKKRDDLQAVISLLESGDYGVPLQFVNMRD